MRALATKLEVLRRHLGDRPIKINSAYRCKERNAEIEDASPNSQHLLGRAVDIHVEGGRDAAFEFVAQAARVGFTGIGIDVRNYRYVHLDTRPKLAYEPATIWFYK